MAAGSWQPAAKPRMRHQSPKPPSVERGTAFGHSQSRDPTGPSAARNTPQHSYHHHSSLLSSVPQRFIIRPSTIIHICDRLRHSYTRSTAYQQPFDSCLRTTARRRISSRVAIKHLTHPSLAQQTSGRVSITLYLRLSLSYHVTSA